MHEKAAIQASLRLLMATYSRDHYGSEEEILTAYLVAVEGAPASAVEIAVRDLLQGRTAENAVCETGLPSAPALARAVRERLYDIEAHNAGFEADLRAEAAEPNVSREPPQFDFSQAAEFPHARADQVVTFRTVR